MRPAAALNLTLDIYKKARELMESSGMIILPQQEVQAGGVHLWQLRRQATSASNGFHTENSDNHDELFAQIICTAREASMKSGTFWHTSIMGLIQVGGNGACSSKKKDQHMPLRVPPSAGRAAAGCTNCSTIVVKLCSEVLIYLPQKFWLDENINLPRRSGLYPDYQPFRRQFSKVFVSLIRIRVDVVPPRP